MPNQTTQKKKILFTGGDALEHLAPTIPVIEAFQKNGWETHCAVMGGDLEKSLIEPTGATMHKVHARPERKGFSLMHAIDSFRTVRGALDTFAILTPVEPDVIFTMGGPLAMPVCTAAKVRRVPVFVHELGASPSLTTQTVLALSPSTILFAGYPPIHKDVWIDSKGNVLSSLPVGIPMPQEVLINAPTHIDPAYRPKKRYSLLVIAGDTDPGPVNAAVRAALPELTILFDIVHVCGKGKRDDSIPDGPHYQQIESIDETLAKVMLHSDIVVTRGDPRIIFTCLTLKRPMLILPVSIDADGSDQALNALFIAKCRYGEIIRAERLTPEFLIEKLQTITKNIFIYQRNLNKVRLPNAANLIVREVLKRVK